MDAVFHQTIADDFAQLKILMDAAGEFLEKEGVDVTAVFRINLTLEEMVTNIIKFGDNAPGRPGIDVTLTVGPKEVTAVIAHEGHEFNPVLHERRQQPERLLDRETGGLGIYLIKKLLGSMEYRREGSRNIVQVKTQRKVAPAGKSSPAR
jgi:serine/threonine-protein kinase RsbW